MGAIGVSLGAMAGNLTVGKKKYAEAEEDVKSMIRRLEALRIRFLSLVQEDADAFEPLSKAYSLPKDTEGYSEIMRRTTLEACAAPLRIMRACAEAVEILEEMLEKCSLLMISDVACGAVAVRAALQAASLNVFINTGTLRGDEEAAAIEREADTLLTEYTARAEAVAGRVKESLRNRRDR